MERKNLVILLDNGRGTSKIAALGKPAIKRQLMKDAVLRSLTTLTDNDKVSKIYSGIDILFSLTNTYET